MQEEATASPRSFYILSSHLLSYFVGQRNSKAIRRHVAAALASLYIKYRCKRRSSCISFLFYHRSLMRDPRRRRWFFFPVWRHNDDEGAAAQVPSESEQQPPGADNPEQKEVVILKDPEAAGPGSSNSSSRAAWWRCRVVTATRGVGLVIGGLVVLAVLLATTTHLDLSSVCSVILY
jgi:hypothetical protein